MERGENKGGHSIWEDDKHKNVDYCNCVADCRISTSLCRYSREPRGEGKSLLIVAIVIVAASVVLWTLIRSRKK